LALQTGGKCDQKNKGKYLEGLRYKQPFREEIKAHQEFEKDRPRAYTVVLSEKYVELTSGTGLVHCAPGCGAEDFEVGTENDLPAFNIVDEHGVFPKEMGPLASLRARKDDARFIKEIEKKGLLIAATDVDHEYPHCWRCKTGVIYKATPQWFLLVENLKKEMIEENKKIKWVPEWAGERWFNSWLENLQNWCISRQRFWGIPLPIWQCESCDEYRLVGSKEELEDLSGKKLDDLHRPYIDEVSFKCNCTKNMYRVEDVLDVWMDSGAASWAPLGFPTKHKLFDRYWPADFILEGKDQIRGWFNSMMCLSMVSHGKVPYRAVYMHGFTNDAQGRKMSKSLGNVISPYEVTEKYGADTLRYYFIGGANPGLDIPCNFEDMKVRHRNLSVLWNIGNFLLDHCSAYGLKPQILSDVPKEAGPEERYILSKLHSTIKDVTSLFDNFRLNEVPWAIEGLYLDLSRTYLQLIRGKASKGTHAEKQLVANTTATVLLGVLKIFSPIVPFFTEAMHSRLKDLLDLTEESVHFYDWPEAHKEIMDPTLETQMQIIKDVIQAALACRDDLQLGVRWPLKEAVVVSSDYATREAVTLLKDLIRPALNVYEVRLGELETRQIIRPNYKTLGPAFKTLAPKVAEALAKIDGAILAEQLSSKGKVGLEVAGEKLYVLADHVQVEEELPEGFRGTEFPTGRVFLSGEMTPELESEGFSREVMRRVQVLRKEAGLQKSDVISLVVRADAAFLKRLKPWKKAISEKVGAKECLLSKDNPADYTHHSKHNVRDQAFELFIKLT